MRLQWRIFAAFCACTLVALAATTWHMGRVLRRFYQEQIAAELAVQAGLLARELATPFRAADYGNVDVRCKEFGRLSGTRVTVILPDGRVLGDSEKDPARMENHGDRPEIRVALAGGLGTALRFSDTLRRTLMYVALPVEQDGAVRGVVRVAVPVSALDGALRGMYRHAALGGLVVAALFALAAFHLARLMTRPLDDLRYTVARWARGDLAARSALTGDPEFAALARALNEMAEELAERMATISRQRDLQQAVFAGMVEGVLAVDAEGRILEVNAAAERLLDTGGEQVRGRYLDEVVRNPDLLRFIDTTRSGGAPAETEIILHGQEERCLQVRCGMLTGPAGTTLGTVVVLNDITRLLRLEQMGRDFVANVSHELKTPITVLKGCVDTLLDREGRRPEDDARFIAMIGRQVERLHAIVEDLLSLSRIEHDEQRKGVAREPGSIGEVLRRAAQAFSRPAEEKGITLVVECPAGLVAPINATLLEQAVGNLIDNAIKYSAVHTRVQVDAAVRGEMVEICVRDQGPGIEKKHLPRIFERFYRVDAARSRALGGTGLGLAIVKHIALAHGGAAAVESTPGQGSVFTIRIPRQ